MRCVVLMNMVVVGCAAVWVYQIASSEERADATARAHAPFPLPALLDVVVWLRARCLRSTWTNSGTSRHGH